MGLGLIWHNAVLAVTGGFLLTALTEMFLIRQWLLRAVIPRHLENLDKIKKLCENFEQFSPQEKINMVEQVADASSWGIVRIGYAALPSWGWEIIFRAIYPLLVKSDEVPYVDLLIGFGNKSVEADQLFWQAANSREPATKQQLLSSYLEKYGSRVDDIDLAKPTLREQPEVITSLLKLYKGTGSPEERLGAAVKYRERSITLANANLKIPKTLFNKLLKIVQNNVQLREDRRFYEFTMDYYLRQMLIKLAKQLNIPDIFNITWREVRHATEH